MKGREGKERKGKKCTKKCDERAELFCFSEVLLTVAVAVANGDQA